MKAGNKLMIVHHQTHHRYQSSFPSDSVAFFPPEILFFCECVFTKQRLIPTEAYRKRELSSFANSQPGGVAVVATRSADSVLFVCPHNTLLATSEYVCMYIQYVHFFADWPRCLCVC